LDKFAIELGATAGIANIRVNGVGKINRRSVFRQFNHIAFRRKDKNSILENINF